MKKVTLRLRMSEQDAHYAGSLVNGSHMLDLFGDVATELLIWSDGDEGLFRTYEHVDFLAPVHAGDFIEAVGWFTKIGNTSRTMEFEAWKVISPAAEKTAESSCDVLAEPVLVCRATGICVVPRDCQRKPFMSHEDLLG